MLESKDFKVFMDFMDSKDATYYMNFKGYFDISIQCIADDDRYAGELIRSSVSKLKYTCIEPLRICFDSKTRESLRRSSSKAKTVTIEGPNVVLGGDQYIVESQYVNEPMRPIIDDETERIQEMTLSRDEFERVVSILHKQKIELARLHFRMKSKTLEVYTYTRLLSLWRFRIPTSSVRFSGQGFEEYFAQEEYPISPHVMNQVYNVNDLLNMIRAVKYHYGRKIMLSLSLLPEGVLLFETRNTDDTLTQRCSLHSVI